ncbi:histone deacetylase family protein [Ochrobactrum sp. CM-21-5]|uniref:Histone deacetylase family protein n=1 Tax=Falsochrobactrum tianjinense TaxID=2706015 RepID=A0A949PM72_9HYPH|nr:MULTISPECIES: histone deacetylase family protein [Brucellaceae]MBC2884570.1 histone deacetylase family protein [Ochrobactrum sp. CM-21-5]MBV2142524.1 histone deacetylase family protein [Falsochrobactrum sp. TDYN1]
MTTRLYWHPIYLEHLVPPGHPERPDRIRALMSELEGPDFYRLDRVEAPRADESAILLAHPEEHLQAVRARLPDPVDDEEAPQPIVKFDGDTYLSPKSWDAALTAIGAATAAVDDVFSGDAHNVFIAARPPGHHAERNVAMGFCLFNTIAIAARHAQQKHGVERVAIVDWDVHHGNGTQDIFERDESVLFCSTHQFPLYPGTGARDETGVGNIVNAPLSPNTGSREFREAFISRVLPALDNFRPDLILISAGFDAHHRDPLAELNLDEADFDWATGKLMERAERFCDHRLVSVLEGGYDLEGLSQSASAHITRLLKG